MIFALAVAALPSFVASVVEWVKAFTIVLAVGNTRGWRSPIWGTAAGLGTGPGWPAAAHPLRQASAAGARVSFDANAHRQVSLENWEEAASGWVRRQEHAAHLRGRQLGIEEPGDLLQGEAEVLQRQDAVEPGDLGRGVVAIAARGAHH